jgi:hypothetical protein
MQNKIRTFDLYPEAITDAEQIGPLDLREEWSVDPGAFGPTQLGNTTLRPPRPWAASTSSPSFTTSKTAE